MRNRAAGWGARIVAGRVDEDWSAGADVLVALLVDERLQLLVGLLGLVQEHMVVHRTRGTLDGGVRAPVGE